MWNAHLLVKDCRLQEEKRWVHWPTGKVLLHQVYIVRVCSAAADCGPRGLKAPLSVGLSRQEYWSRCPSPGHLPNPGSNPSLPGLLNWQADSLPLSHQGSPCHSTTNRSVRWVVEIQRWEERIPYHSPYCPVYDLLGKQCPQIITYKKLNGANNCGPSKERCPEGNQRTVKNVSSNKQLILGNSL